MSRDIIIVDRLSAYVERFGPITLSVGTGLVILSFRNEVAAAIVARDINMANLYSAVLSWASIQIGFAFGVYGFVVGKTQGFVEAIRETRALNTFLKYVRRANMGGFVLTFVSLPLAVSTPYPKSAESASFLVICCWFTLFVWTFFAFLRIAFNFGHLTAIRDQPEFHGA